MRLNQNKLCIVLFQAITHLHRQNTITHMHEHTHTRTHTHRNPFQQTSHTTAVNSQCSMYTHHTRSVYLRCWHLWQKKSKLWIHEWCHSNNTLVFSFVLFLLQNEKNTTAGILRQTVVVESPSCECFSCLLCSSISSISMSNTLIFAVDSCNRQAHEIIERDSPRSVPFTLFTGYDLPYFLWRKRKPLVYHNIQ